ncbi:hypothetical protein DOTSEDRAFT_73908 [Dothistroma septosporum NZE10]|uniref:Uncharacterized protein n=1 Tax=Dothistroma septosporum (strain NZE10 / CBS 128990) TaxID=675120 RepID=N1PJE5_DOTSN|nr:hypothetical protein DOTSEDRAFT_73908 [Dothistroma septosporum NZE10]
MNQLCDQLHKMEPPTTPPRRTPRSNRARTPPSPRHGALFDDYEPYSPRRSTRSTLTSNPYSSVNRTSGSDIVAEIHETPAKKSRFSVENLLSPPSSPASAPRKMLDFIATPRRADNTNHDNANHNHHLEPSSATRAISGMLPTPSKTPTTTPARKHQRASSMQDTARVLQFQPGDPNDVMPTRRDKRKQKPARNVAAQDFGLDGDDFSETASQRSGSFQIYAEAHARVPQLDTSAENPFYRSRANTVPATRSSTRRTRKTQAQILEDQRMESAVQREEGIVFMFRGKKVFRKFQDSETGDVNLEQSSRQRALKRSVGTAAERPITRSNIQPRLLFGTFDSGYAGSDDVDEEAETDLDVPDAPATEEAQPTSVPIKVVSTPARSKPGSQRIMTPPTTARTTRKRDVEEALDEQATPGSTFARTNKNKKVTSDSVPIFKDNTSEPVLAEEPEAAAVPPTPQRTTRKKAAERNLTPIIEDELGHVSGNSQESPSSATRRKTRSPFDDWPRTKSAHKREGEWLESSSSKRTRGAAAAAAP